MGISMEALKRADHLRQRLEALRPLDDEDEARVMQKFRLDWNYHSSNIEGNLLTYGETKALILFNITAEGKPLQHHLEMTGHNQAVESIMDFVQHNRPLTEAFVRELHQILLKQPYEVDAISPDGKPVKKKIQIGRYKSTPNHVRTSTGEIFRFATPEETPAKMHDLMQWYRQQAKSSAMNPILLASHFHYKFVRIHPFDDGNGRTARLLMNFVLMQYGFPPAVIRTEDKDRYFAVLLQADSGNITPFVEFVSENLVSSLELMIRAANGEDIEEPEDIDKEIAMLDRRLRGAHGPIKETKSSEGLRSLFASVLVPLAAEFQGRCEVFDKYYATASLQLHIGSELFDLKSIDEVAALGEHVKEDTSRIMIRYKYTTFVAADLGELSFTSSITFHFRETGYSVRDTLGKSIIEKRYTESLSDLERNALVGVELRRHKDMIEAKLDNMLESSDDQ